MDWSPLKDRLIEAAAAAALLGGGAQVINTAIDVGQHDVRIGRLERLDERLDTIAKDVSETRETVIRLEAKSEVQ